MKKSLVVLFAVLTVFFMWSNVIPLAIFSAMFFVICLIIPSNTHSKTPEEYLEEARNKINGVTDGNVIHVEYEFISLKGESFTHDLPSYGGELSEEKVLTELAEYLSEYTGIPISEDRLHIVSFRKQS